jgi:hypothetical protein
MQIPPIPPVPPVPTPPGLDPNYVFSELMPLIAIVGIIIFSAIGLRLIFRTPVGEAIAQRIRSRLHGGRSFEDDQARAELEERLAQLQEQVGELTERVDFAERLLAGQRDRQLGGGR